MKSIWHKLTPNVRGILTVLAALAAMGICALVYYALDAINPTVAIVFWIVLILVGAITGNSLLGPIKNFFKKLFGG